MSLLEARFLLGPACEIIHKFSPGVAPGL